MMIEECQEFHHRRLAGMYDICIHLQYNTLKKKTTETNMHHLENDALERGRSFQPDFWCGYVI